MPTSPSFKPAAATMFMHVTFHGQREEPFCSTPAVKKVDASKKRAFLPNVSGSSWGPGFGKQPSITERQSMSPSSMYSMVDRRTRKQQQMSLRSLRKQWNRPATELRSPLLAASPLSRSSSSIQMRLSKTMDSFGSTSGSHLPALSRKSSRARLILSLESATSPSRSRSTNMHGNGRGEDQDEARSRLPSVTSHHGNAAAVREGGSGAAESYRVQTPTLPALHRKSGHKLTASDVDLAELLRRSTSSKPSSPQDKERGSPNNGGRRVSIRIGSKDSNNSSGGLSACSRSSSSSASSGCSDVPPPPPGYFERVLVGSGGSQSTFRRRRAPHQSMMISAVKHHSMEKAVSVFQQLKSDTDHEMLRELVPQALRELGYRQVNTQWVEELANDIIGETSFLDLAEFGKLLDGYNSKRLQHLRSEFPKIVKNGQSMATYADVTDYLEADGIITVPGMILELLKEKHDGTDPHGVDMNDYIHLREVFMYRGGFTEVEAESMHALFNRYDDNGNGTMDLEELASAVRWLGFSLRGADADGPNIEELTEGVWAGSNGFDFEDFLQVVQHHREKEILAARALFAKHATGKDHRGTSVDVEGGVQILFALGYITSTAALLQDACDERGLGVIERLDFNNFYMILTGLRRREGFKRSEFEDFRQAFAAHDVDDSGAVDVVELGGALRWLGYPVTVEVQQELMYDVDVDRSGEIDFDEFLKIMRWYKEAEFQGLERAFKQGDLDGNGTLDMKEVRHLLPALGYYLLTPDQEKVVRKHLRTGSINFRQCAAMIEDLRVVTRKAFIETCGFTDVDLKQLRELFSKYDHRSKGFIGPKELRTLLSEAFPEATQTRQGQEKVAELLSRVDADGDGTLVWQEFLHLMRQVQDREDWKWVLHEQEMASKAGFTPNEIRDLRRVFKICDSDASRTLNADEVIRMLLTLIPLDYVMREKVRSLIVEVDKDGNDVLSFTEFLLLMRQVEKANIYDLGLGDESKRPSKTADA